MTPRSNPRPTVNDELLGNKRHDAETRGEHKPENSIHRRTALFHVIGAKLCHGLDGLGQIVISLSAPHFMVLQPIKRNDAGFNSLVDALAIIGRKAEERHATLFLAHWLRQASNVGLPIGCGGDAVSAAMEALSIHGATCAASSCDG